jgi:hypothetical protein
MTIGNYSNKVFFYSFFVAMILFSTITYASSCGSGSSSCNIHVATYVTNATTTTTSTSSSSSSTTTTTIIPSGGGGGTVIIPSASNFTIQVTRQSLQIAPNDELTSRVLVKNLGNNNITVKLKITGSGDDSRNWVTFENNLSEINVDVASLHTVSVMYDVSVPASTEEGTYTFMIYGISGSKQVYDIVTVDVNKKYGYWYNQPVFNDIEYAKDTSFSTISGDITNSAFIDMGWFKIWHLMLIILLLIVILSYIIIKKRRN